MKIFLILFLFTTSGPPQIAQVEQDSLKTCLASAEAFLTQDPRNVDAPVYTAACEIRKAPEQPL